MNAVTLPVTLARAVLAAGLVGGSFPVAAATAPDASPRATYPAQVITLIVPFAAGGPTEAMARILAHALGRELQARVIVETVGGEGGARGAERVARARADGYTLLLHHAGHAAAPFVHRRLAYDPVADFAPIGVIAEVPMTLIGRPELPTRFADLERLMRAQGPAFRWGHAGPGSASYLCGTRVSAAVQAKPTAVSYKGTARAIDELQKGKIDVLCDQTLNTVEAIRTQRVRAYLIAGDARVPALPDVPTAKEAGAAGLNVVIWYGLFAPVATPRPVLEKLSAALAPALERPALRDALLPLGVRLSPPAAATPAALRERVAADTQRWRELAGGSEAGAERRAPPGRDRTGQ